MRKYVLILSIAGAYYSAPALAQKQANLWYFGEYAGLDFNSGAPVLLTNGQTHNSTTNIEGCATISDSAGQLLFYTDGETVYNHLHALMPNGTNIGGGQSSSQSSVILPMPGDPNKYYIFTTDDFIHQLNNGLNYSIVDMCLDGGNGDVMLGFKNIHLMDTASEKVAVCRHSNGTDYWVVSQKHFTNIFYAWQVSAAGIINPVVSPVGPVHGDGSAASSYGEMKISPDHSRIALVDGQGQFPYAEILDFDNTNGSISNADTLLSVTYPGPAVWYYGVSFSPNSRFLYFATSGFNPRIVQYDLVLDSIVYDIPCPPGTIGIQLATDGKIYCVDAGSPGTISVINQPDLSGAACNYVPQAISLNGANVSYGLPEFLDDFVYSNTTPACALPVAALAASDATICPGTCINFTNLSLNAVSYQWSFQGATPDTSTDVNPQNICYAVPGTYYVTLSATNANGTDLQTLNNYITVYPQPAPQSITQSGDTLFAIAGAMMYQWYFNGNLIGGATDYFYIATASGDYNVVCVDDNGCEVEAAIFNVIAEIQLATSSGQWAISPNPVWDKITIQKTKVTSETAMDISIYNMIGASVLAVCLPTAYCLLPTCSTDVSNLPPGLYYIEITSSPPSGISGQFRTKFVKQ